jgi:hypothetical protein
MPFASVDRTPTTMRAPGCRPDTRMSRGWSSTVRRGVTATNTCARRAADDDPAGPSVKTNRASKATTRALRTLRFYPSDRGA